MMDSQTDFMMTLPPTASRPLAGLTLLLVEDSRFAVRGDAPHDPEVGRTIAAGGYTGERPDAPTRLSSCRGDHRPWPT
jgi:hypothetical protein